MTEKHKFEGNGPVCALPGCYLLPDAECHKDVITEYDFFTMTPEIIQAVVQTTVNSSPNCPECNHSAIGHDDKNGCSFIGCACLLTSDGQPIERSKQVSEILQAGVFDPAKGSPCPGHTCPICSVVWTHDYTCGLDSSSIHYGLCKSCAQSAAALINRTQNIEAIKQLSQSNVLENRQIVEIMLAHKDFVVLSICKGPDGKDYPDWQERLHKHRIDLRSKIDALRAKEMATSEVMARLQMEEITRLSPEERTAYENAARRNKKPKLDANGRVAATATPKAPNKDDQKKLYEKMLKDLNAAIRTKRPGLSEDEYMARAKKKFDQIMSEDAG